MINKEDKITSIGIGYKEIHLVDTAFSKFKTGVDYIKKDGVFIFTDENFKQKRKTCNLIPNGEYEIAKHKLKEDFNKISIDNAFNYYFKERTIEALNLLITEAIRLLKNK